jgi:hypothetical protein
MLKHTFNPIVTVPPQRIITAHKVQHLMLVTVLAIVPVPVIVLLLLVRVIAPVLVPAIVLVLVTVRVPVIAAANLLF